MNVRDIMTAHPATCTPDTSVQEIAKMMVDFDCGDIPVLRSDTDDTPIGIVTDRDIVCRLLAQGKNPLDCHAKDCMTTPCVTIKPDASLQEARDLMSNNQIRRLVVCGDDGKCCGVVSLADLVREIGAQDVVREVSEPSEQPSNVGKKEFEPV